MPPRNSGGIPYASTSFSLNMEMSRLTRDGTAEPVSRDQILRRERGQGNIPFCSADYEQDWQPYLVDPTSCYICDHTTPYIHNIPFLCVPQRGSQKRYKKCARKGTSTGTSKGMY